MKEKTYDEWMDMKPELRLEYTHKLSKIQLVKLMISKYESIVEKQEGILLDTRYCPLCFFTATEIVSNYNRYNEKYYYPQEICARCILPDHPEGFNNRRCLNDPNVRFMDYSDLSDLTDTDYFVGAKGRLQWYKDWLKELENQEGAR